MKQLCICQEGNSKIQEHPSTEISSDKFFADTKIGFLDLPARSFVTSILEPLVSDLLRSCSDGPKLVTSTLGDHAAITSKLFWQQSDFFYVGLVPFLVLSNKECARFKRTSFLSGT